MKKLILSLLPLMVLASCRSDKNENKVGRYVPVAENGYLKGILDTKTGNFYYRDEKFYKERFGYIEFIQPNPEKD